MVVIVLVLLVVVVVVFLATNREGRGWGGHFDGSIGRVGFVVSGVSTVLEFSLRCFEIEALESLELCVVADDGVY